MSAAVEIFEPLREEDVRAIQFRDPARVKSLLKNEPLHVLRAVVERHDGRAGTAAIKNALYDVVTRHFNGELDSEAAAKELASAIAAAK